jgi:DNA-binding transcriptional regulator YhcF (GntR family)
MKKINIIKDNTISKFSQVVKAIIIEIEKGNFHRNEKLPSITNFSKEYKISRDTVEKAYKQLIKQGYVKAIKGKGNFVIGKADKLLKILLIFNKLSSYKKIIYDSFLSRLAGTARVNFHVHYYNPKLLEEIIDENLGHYHYYVVMPHFLHESKEQDYLRVIEKIPLNQLVLLDKEIPKLKGKVRGVYQDFKENIYDALKSMEPQMSQYKRLVVVFPKYSNHPLELNEGVMRFCMEAEKQFLIVSDINNEILEQQTLYILLTESDLASLIKKLQVQKLAMGKEVGILSFNETVFKELLDITVVTTDFEQMGVSAAELILDNSFSQINNPFHIIKRNSV